MMHSIAPINQRDTDTLMPRQLSMALMMMVENMLIFRVQDFSTVGQIVDVLGSSDMHV